MTLNDLIALRASGKSCSDLLFLRYGCEMEEKRRKFVSESKVISSIIENVDSGVDPHIYAGKITAQWSGYSTRQQLEDLVKVLNPRGIRELKLKTKLQKMKDRIESRIDRCLLFSSTEETKVTRPKRSKNDIVDKSLFRTMEDYLEANLRDQLLELEERLWQASLGIVKLDDRDGWRTSIGAKINDLLMGKVEEPTENSSGDSRGEIFQDGGEKCLENGMSNSHFENSGDIENDVSKDDSVNSELDSNEEQDASTISKKTLPLKLMNHSILKEENSRCSTPVNVSTPMINPNVKVLASVLLEVFSPCFLVAVNTLFRPKYIVLPSF